MARLGVIELDQLPAMQVLEKLDSESILSARMAQFVALWKSHDPPAGAEYDVENLEFDPIKITQEASTYFELLVRDRVNQAAKAVTLAFASGSDLDAIGSRYPGGMPRLSGESDDHYRMRIWLSANTLSPHGVYESYVFWALTADKTLRDATAVAQRGTPNVAITIMADGTPVKANAAKNGITTFPSPTPTIPQIDVVRSYVENSSRKALTDVVSVRAPKIVKTNYKIDVWLFPSWDVDLMMPELYVAAAELIEKQRWLGYSHTIDSIDAALKRSGVYKIKVIEPAADVEIDRHEAVQVGQVTIRYAGRGGFEEPTEPT
ncbi:baseplate J/gp47 family protein [Bradyrhizobium paxllaeri]|uniref:baseplate J/gp47 family protein n=1 Tax=Bradyrhizobium paxllaeri TaxID=190148 RepID=UPI000810A326|nr:baseplate J/gp47 family protein [Bradyrhizobium paxllaeri]